MSARLLSRRRLLMIMVSLFGLWGLMLLLIIIGPLIRPGGGKSTITVSPETTHFLGPVDERGYVDYAEAVNLALEQDIRPEDNFAVILFEVLGPHPEESEIPDEFYERLGMSRPPDEGDYFVTLSDWLIEHHPIDFERSSAICDRMMASPWKANDLPVVYQWLKEIRLPLNRLARGIRRKHYFKPATNPADEPGRRGPLIAALLPDVTVSRGIARAFIARSMLRLSEDSHEEAWNDLLACHCFSRHLSHGASLLDRTLAATLEALAIKAETHFLHYVHPNSGRVAILRSQLTLLPMRGAMAEAVDNGERAMFLDSVSEFSSGNTEFLYALTGIDRSNHLERLHRIIHGHVDWDFVMKSGNHWYDRVVDTVNLPDYHRFKSVTAALCSDLRSLHAKTGDPANWWPVLVPGMHRQTATYQTADEMVLLMLPAVTQARTCEERVTQYFRNYQVALALAAWHSDHGSYPERLERLTPELIEAVPEDVFSGNPVKYRREGDGYVLYSVGCDETDNDGQSWEDNPRGDDITIRMPYVPEVSTDAAVR